MARCPVCEFQESDQVTALRPIPLVPAVPDIVVDVELTYERCPNCAYEFFTPEQSTLADQAIAKVKRDFLA